MALFLSLILNMIVLFNLLISIVSETFDHVKTNRVEFEFHQRADAIATIQRIIPFRWLNLNNENRNLDNADSN